MMKYSDRPNAYINAKDLEIAIVKATSYGDALDAVREAPTIEIIRCGECKRANYEWSGVRCGLSDALMGEDGFCSIGERRESRDR